MPLIQLTPLWGQPQAAEVENLTDHALVKSVTEPNQRGIDQPMILWANK